MSRFLLAYNSTPGASGTSWWNNEHPQRFRTELGPLVTEGVHIFLDSGAFTFCHDYGRATGVPGEQVFSYGSHEFGDSLEDYATHYGRYVSEIQDLLWGAVEIDIGTQPERVARRQRIASEFGVHLIPVFRPESDSLEYLDRIMRENDRICLPVTVKALPPYLRWALVAKAVEFQKTRHPHCYIHVLGTAPVFPWVSLAAASGSCDSSTWTNPGRYGNRPTYAHDYSVQLRGECQEGDILLSSVHGRPRAGYAQLQRVSIANMVTFMQLNSLR